MVVSRACKIQIKSALLSTLIIAINYPLLFRSFVPMSSSSPAIDPTKKPTTMIDMLSSLLKAQTGQDVSDHNVAQLLINNMTTLVQQGKLSQQQIIQVRARMSSMASSTTFCSSKCTPTNTRIPRHPRTGQAPPLHLQPRLLRILRSALAPILFPTSRIPLPPTAPIPSAAL